jgi:PhzF family phenazine biosynthesis protein
MRGRHEAANKDRDSLRQGVKVSGDRLTFRQVDVFTSVPFKGNPVAVVHGADRLSAERMQSIAAWTNLSETTFVCEPTDERADYRLRIFSPRVEMPFAGHPTLGSAHSVLSGGLRPGTEGRLIQQCGKGLVTVRLEGERLFFELPHPAMEEIGAERLSALADALGISTHDVGANALIDVGPVWATLQLEDADAVRRLRPDMTRVAALASQGVGDVTVFGLEAEGADAPVEVRSFAPADATPEDPVCGSGNGCVAALVRRERLLDGRSYVARQGGCLGRDGRVEVRFDEEGSIWVGGHAVTCVEGALYA